MINALNKREIEKMAVSELMELTDLLGIQSLTHIYPPSYYSSSPSGEGRGEGHCFSDLKCYNNLPIAS
jgi:hypothetical protein